MLDVTVKTLDGQNKSYSVPDDMTVRQFKEKIANSINISADVQRLIYLGRVLQDEKKLNDYDVNGKVIHVVQRPPASSRSATGASNTATPSSTREGSSYVLGSFTLPSDIMDPGQVQNIVQSAVSGMGDIGRNAQITTRSSDDGSSVDVHINLGQIPAPQVQSESEGRLAQARRMLEMARETLHRLENPPQQSDENAMETDQSNETTAAQSADNNSETATSASSSSQSAANNGSAANASGEGQPRTPVQPTSDALGTLLGEVTEFNASLQPHLERYRQIMNSGPTFSNPEESRTAQRLCNLVSEILHYVSHIYHNISDLMIDMTQAPPRNLRAPPAPSPQPAAVIQHTIPVQTVQTQINLASSLPGSPRQQRRPTSTAPSTSVTSTASTTSTTATTAASGVNVSSSQVNGQATPTAPPLSGGTTSRGPPPPPPPLFSENRPYMFMEVGPHSFNINSITAHVVTAAGTRPTPTASASSGAQPPGARATNVSSSTTSTPQPAPSSTAPGGPHPPHPGLGIGVIPIPGVHIAVGPHGAARHTRLPGQPQPAGPGGMPPFMPPNVMQNIIQMATQAALSRASGQPPQGVAPSAPPASAGADLGTPSTASSTPSSASTQTSTSASGSNTQTGSAQTGSDRSRPNGQRAGSQPQAFVIQGDHLPGGPLPGGPLPGGPLPGLGTTGIFSGPPGPFVSMDMYLPCHSRHFLARRAMGGQGAPADQNPEQSLAGMVSNLVGSLLGQQNPHMTGEPAGTTGSQTASTRTASASSSTSGRSSTTTTASGTGTPLVSPWSALFSADTPNSRENSGQPAPNFMDQLSSILQQTNRGSATSLAGTNSTTTSTTMTSPPLDDQVFSQLVQGIGGYVSQAAMGNLPTDTISDFLGSVLQDGVASDEGLLTDIFQCISRHLTVVDLMGVLFGAPAPLGRLRTPLQEFIRERVLRGGEMTEENLIQGIDRVMNELKPEIEAACNDVVAADDIDFQATLTAYVRIQLRATIQMIMNSPEGDADFGANLYQRCRLFIHEFVALCRFCLGGVEPLERMVHGRVRNISSDINPMIQQWMLSVSTQQLRQMLPGMTATQQQIQHYIIHKQSVAMETTSPMSAASENAESMSAEENDNSAATQREKEENSSSSSAQMDIDSPSEAVNEKAETEREKSLENLVNGAYALVPPPPTLTDEDKDVRVDLGSESWHQAVPLDWVPIITRDIQRQRRQAPQTPYSDAYLNTMPTKRRKVVAEEKAQVNVTNAQETISSSLRRAVVSAGVEPITSVEALTRDAAQSRELQSLYEQQVESDLQKRLDKDKDYIPEKFPHTEKRFPKKNK